MNAELEESLDAVGGVLVAGVQRLDDGEPLGVLVLARAADDSDVGLRRRHPVDAEEAERVAVRLDAAAVEHGREHERLAGPASWRRRTPAPCRRRRRRARGPR